MVRSAIAAVVSVTCAATLVVAGLLAGPALAANDAVDRAVKELGGAEALGAVKSIALQAATQHWEPAQSEVAGGEKRFAGDSTYTQTRDLTSGAARTEWVRKLVYPGTREYRFTEVVVGGSGYVNGIDTTARTKQSQDSNPPAHAMSKLRAAAAARELLRSSPLLALQMQREAASVSELPAVSVSGTQYPAASWKTAGHEFIVLFDPASGLPARVRTLDYDPIQGDSDFDLVLSDYRPVGGVKIAHRQVYELNGTPVVQTELSSARINQPLEKTAFEIPAAYRSEPLPAGAPVPYQWVIRRQYAGTYLDADPIGWDPGASQGPRLEEIAPGVHMTQGVSHNSTIVAFDEYLVVFDAPVSDAQAQWTLEAAQQKFPGKPVKYLVLTHHHIDHTAGTRVFAAAGAQLVVGAGNGAWTQALLAAPTTRNPALQGKSVPAGAVITEVADKLELGDAKRKLSVHAIENPHAKALLIGWVEDAKLGIVTDLWSPGRDPLPEQANPNLAAVVRGVQKHGLAPERFAGGHGNTAPYAPLAKLVESSGG
jgi:glyoxylase-like metal-dependent hydrolase (beta-lactamase superfamily II)